MPRLRLTDLTIRTLPYTPKGQLDIWDETFPTFGIRVGMHTKTFVLNRNGVRETIGRYHPPHFTLKHARHEARRRLAQQYLPQEPHASSKNAVEEYLVLKKSQLKPASFYAIGRALEKVFPVDRDLTSLTYASLDLKNRNVYSLVKAFLNWCRDTRKITAHPLESTRRPFKATSRSRVLTDAELVQIWGATKNLAPFDCVVRLLLLSGQRRAQIVFLQPNWIRDDILLEFPTEIMKGNKVHVVPMTQPMRDIFTHAIKQAQPNASKTLFPPMNIQLLKAQLDKTLQIPHWTLHDLRRTFATKMAEWEICPIDITEAILDHTSGSRSQIQRTYDRHSRLSQMLRALKKHNQKILELVEPQA